MKIEIEIDEKWPVFILIPPEKNQNSKIIDKCLVQDEFIEIPEEIARKFFRIQEEYQKMQKSLEEMYDNAQNNNQLETSQNSLWNNMSENSSGVY